MAPVQSSAKHWAGKNRCWEWIKHEGCYAAGFNISWRDAQTLAAKKLLAPYPDVFPIEPLRRPGVCEHYALGSALHAEEEEKEAAKKWFQDTVSVYVVNLLGYQERWNIISRHLYSLGISFQRWPGVDLTPPNAYRSAMMSELVPWDYNFSQALFTWQKKFNVPGGLAGSAGRSAAHLSAMRNLSRAARQQVPGAPQPKPLVLILEDDVVLQADFQVKLRRLVLQDAPCDWVAISLHSVCPYGTCVSPHLLRVEPDGNEPADRCHHGVNYGFEGMLYRLSNMADLEARLSKTVWDSGRPHCLDIDVALASISNEVAYYAVPGMQVPGMLMTRQMQPRSVRMVLNRADQTSVLEDQMKIDKALDMQEVERAYAYKKKLERLQGLDDSDAPLDYVHYERTTRTETTTTTTTTITTETATTTTVTFTSSTTLTLTLTDTEPAVTTAKLASESSWTTTAITPAWDNNA